MKHILAICFVLCSGFVSGQTDYSWWVAIHHWDGYTSWQHYMTISPAFMGPNALPVPDVSKAENDSTFQLEAAGDAHFSTGDHTQDFFVRGYAPFYNSKIAFSIDVIPIEWFQTDTITRDLRASRGKSGKGKAGGDIYFTTYIQLLKDKKHWPDLSLRMALRTASGTNLGEARYTDGPGYYFDVSGGKTFATNKKFLKAFRVYAMAGFYVYQTFDILHLQNDCFLYGAGIDFRFNHFAFTNEIAGYNGYMSDGDKPLVFRTGLKFSSSKIDYKISYQAALNDFPTDRVRVGVVFRFGNGF